MRMRTMSMLTTIAAVGGVLTVARAADNPVAGTPAYGTGAYFALHGGANVYQDFHDSFSLGDNKKLDIDHNVGEYGGIKLGYVFGTGTYRFALEEDMFYNGIPTSAHVEQNGSQLAHSSNRINSGAFMTNFLMKFAFDRFQPYGGAGIGAYYAKTESGDVTVNGQTFNTGGGRSSGSLAWDGVAGTDYYWTSNISTFVEYHYLEYVALDVGNGNRRFGQNLVGAGLRFHFCL